MMCLGSHGKNAVFVMGCLTQSGRKPPQSTHDMCRLGTVKLVMKKPPNGRFFSAIYSPTPAFAVVTKGGNTPSLTVIPTFGPRKILILWVIPGREPLCSCTMDTGLRRYDDKSIISLLKKSRHPDAGRGLLCSALMG